jgi:hypothetical protein
MVLDLVWGIRLPTALIRGNPANKRIPIFRKERSIGIV